MPRRRRPVVDGFGPKVVAPGVLLGPAGELVSFWVHPVSLEAGLGEDAVPVPKPFPEGFQFCGGEEKTSFLKLDHRIIVHRWFYILEDGIVSGLPVPSTYST